MTDVGSVIDWKMPYDQKAGIQHYSSNTISRPDAFASIAKKLRVPEHANVLISANESDLLY